MQVGEGGDPCEVGPEAAPLREGPAAHPGVGLDGGPAVSQHPIEHRRVPLLEPRSRHPDRGDLARCGELHAESLQEALIVGGEPEGPAAAAARQRHAATGPGVRPREGRLEDALGDPARDLGGRTPREHRGDEFVPRHAYVVVLALPGRGVHQESPGHVRERAAIEGRESSLLRRDRVQACGQLSRAGSRRTDRLIGERSEQFTWVEARSLSQQHLRCCMSRVVTPALDQMRQGRGLPLERESLVPREVGGAVHGTALEEVQMERVIHGRAPWKGPRVDGPRRREQPPREAIAFEGMHRLDGADEG